MNVTKRSILIAFVLTLVCGFLYLYTNSFFKTKIVRPEGLPTFIAYDSEISVFGKTGKLERTITSTKITYYNDKNLYFFERPFITSYSYNKNQTDIWHVKGQRGSLIVDKYATISDDVVLTPGFEGAPIQKATAFTMKYDFKTNTLTSPSLVSIFGQAYKTQGTDFSFDLNSNILDYKGKPHATFYPEKK